MRKPEALPTVQDVASAAGVSTATVSRVLNRPSSVRPVLR
ncbi:MAG: LacI family DNA-binding transcriptional regulator, partial [Gammaproteobacteria bacterium]|nr:LacI family DNA-binding transcriptional regulator [Gammaproteobacteria bacterium]